MKAFSSALLLTVSLMLAAQSAAQTEPPPPAADTADDRRGSPGDAAPPPAPAPTTRPAPTTAPPATGAPPATAPPATQPPPGYAYPPPPGYYPVVPVYVAPQQPVQEVPAWKEGEPAPPGYRVESKVDVKTIRSGVGLLVGLWIFSVVAGAVLNEAEKPEAEDGDDVEPGDWSVLYWPVAGPFLAMNNVNTDDAGWAFLLLDGIGQSVGVLAILIGLASRNETLVRNSAKPSLHVVPTLNHAGAGVGVLGTF